MGVCLCGVYVWVLYGVGVCMCGFCNVWECVCVCFLVGACVYVWICNVWVCVFVCFVTVVVCICCFVIGGGVYVCVL